MKSLVYDSNFKKLLPQTIIDLSKLFNDNGLSLYVVGGCVRDYHLGSKPKDFDVCTNALPDKIIEILKNNNIKCTLHGEAFGVVVAYTDELPLGCEIATFRKDIYTEDTLGVTRNCEVVFATLEEDAKRRDLTINSIYYDIVEEAFIDFNNGFNDLKNGVIRMVGNPHERLLEDKLRALRAIRFHIRTKFKIHIDTLNAISNCDLDNISMERVWSDIRKKNSVSDKKGEIISIFEKSTNIKDLIDILIKTNLHKHIFFGFDVEIPTNIEKVTTIEKFIDIFVPNAKPNELTEKLKINSNITRKLEVLRKIKSDEDLLANLDSIISIKRRIEQLEITKDEILDFSSDDNLMVQKFVDFDLDKNLTNKLITEGFKGKQLGDKILEVESHRFMDFISQ